jgi:hypothetical protein
MATLWSLFHIPIGVGLVWLYIRLDHAGLFVSAWGRGGFYAGAAMVVFCTAYVIPYVAFSRVYRNILTTA